MTTNITLKKINPPHKVFILLLVSFFAGCDTSPHTKDLSHISLEMNSLRFEQELFQSNSVSEILKLKETHPHFYDVYTSTIIGPNVFTPGGNDTDLAVEVYKYIAHKDMDSLYSIVQGSFNDFSTYENELQQAAKYINFYFPNEKIENVTTFISTFQYGSIFDQEKKSFGVGLDMYLGSDFEVYTMLNPEHFPMYRIAKFEPYRIAPNCVQTFMDYKIPNPNTTTFIEQAVHEGKKLYLLDLLLPEYHDSLKINYLGGQIEWAEANEENIWTFLVEEEMIFNSDKNKYQKHFFNESPFTSPFGNESSPRIGLWVGWQIIRSYMKNHPDVDIHELLNNDDLVGIFRASGYRP
jgi:hypothetical protein